jgi:hypothetical protein
MTSYEAVELSSMALSPQVEFDCTLYSCIPITPRPSSEQAVADHGSRLHDICVGYIHPQRDAKEFW